METTDKIKARRALHRAQLHVLYVPYFDQLCEVLDQTAAGLGWAPYISMRSAADQDADFEKGRTQPGAIITNARGWQSPHQYGCATDWADFTEGNVGGDPWSKADWHFFGECVKASSARWGGDWNGDGIREKGDWDRVHVELPINVSWTIIAAEMLKNGRDAADKLIVEHSARFTIGE